LFRSPQRRNTPDTRCSRERRFTASVFLQNVFIDNSNDGGVILIDASKPGKKVKDGKTQKTLISDADEQHIIRTFNAKETVDDFSVAVSYADIEARNYSLSAGQYFEVRIEYMDITPEEFREKMKGHQKRLSEMFLASHDLENEITKQLTKLNYG
jgi:type I restriction enzyme M protein